MNQQEDHFHNEKQRIIKIYEEKCIDLKAVELQNYHKDCESLPKLDSVKEEEKLRSEEENFKIQLEVENQNKLSQY